MYGIVKNYKDPHRTFISPQTKLPNLYFTGQNLNMHGILGTALSGLATCTAIMGNDSIIEKISHA
jgi:all-trans-retinol 13,14-reductase